MWADYFEEHNIPYVFWSAHAAQKEMEREAAAAVAEEIQQLAVSVNGPDAASEASDDESSAGEDDEDIVPMPYVRVHATRRRRARRRRRAHNDIHGCVPCTVPTG